MPCLDPLPLRALTAAAGIALAALHVPAHATPNWLTAAAACTADSPESLQNTLVVASDGLLRHGREPPARYICPVWSPEDLAATPPTWQALVLTAIDASSAGGKVKASLYAKGRNSKKATLIAVAESAGGSTALQSTRVTLRKALDFERNAYYVVLDMDMADSALAPNEAHMVRLEN